MIQKYYIIVRIFTGDGFIETTTKSSHAAMVHSKKVKARTTKWKKQ